MNEENDTQKLSREAVDQQQVCSALLTLLPVCDEYDNGETWMRGMVLSDAIAFKNTWFWRTGDPWLGGINELIHDLAIPAEWVEWCGDGVALIRIGNVVGALTYVRDSRYECFALAWPNDADQIPRTHDVANTTDSPERLSASVLFASCDGLVAAMSRCDCIYVDTTGAGAVIADMAESAGIKITRFRRASGLLPRRHSDCVQHDQPSQSAKQYAQQP